jgi:hypothetical protein
MLEVLPLDPGSIAAGPYVLETSSNDLHQFVSGVEKLQHDGNAAEPVVLAF